MSIARACYAPCSAPRRCCEQDDGASHGSMSETDGSVASGSGSGASSGWVTDDMEDMEDTDDEAEGMADAVGRVELWRFRLHLLCAQGSGFRVVELCNCGVHTTLLNTKFHARCRAWGRRDVPTCPRPENERAATAHRLRLPRRQPETCCSLMSR